MLPSPSGEDIYAIRLTGAGTPAPGWLATGNPICTAPGDQGLVGDVGPPPSSIPDGEGGLYVLFLDLDNSGGFVINDDIRLQRITGSGQIVAGWPVEGVAVCTAPDRQIEPRLVTDGAGGVIVAWSDFRTGRQTPQVYALRVNADGTVPPGWNVNGNLVCDAPGIRLRPNILPDGEGGVFIAFHDMRTAPSGVNDPYPWMDVYLTRLTGEGVIAPGWPSQGLPVAAGPDPQDFIRVAPDGAGGLFVAWTDQLDVRAYVQRIMPSGTVASGWPSAGMPVATQNGGQLMYSMVTDEVGGAYLAWHNRGPITLETFVQRITSNGQPAIGWPEAGLSLSPPPPLIASQQGPSMKPDGLGGAIIAWTNQQQDPPRFGIYAQRIGIAGPTPVQIALVEARAEAGWARLTWHAPQGPQIVARVERTSGEAEWLEIGTPDVASDGHVTFEDRDVAPGGRYGYRLRYSDGVASGYTAETWLTIPLAARFALHRLSPNPSAGDAVVSFSLASGEPAALEVFDVRGRQVAMHDLAGRGAGLHEIPLARARLPAGVYAVRLRQGVSTATSRAVVIR